MAWLVTGKILRSTEMKFEGTESQSGIWLKKNIINGQEFSSE